MRSPVQVQTTRKILCVFPAYTPAFGTFAHAFPLLYDVHAFMPPQGLLVLAAYLPEAWPVRFIDENIARATVADFEWADAIMVSGMHVQAPQVRDIHRRAKAAGKPMALGGPSVSARRDVSGRRVLHIGEIGDATDAMIARLAAHASPAKQVRFTTKAASTRRFPIPAYGLIPLGNISSEVSSFRADAPTSASCIPGLYGRVPRLKSAEQIITELECMLAQLSTPEMIDCRPRFDRQSQGGACSAATFRRMADVLRLPRTFACEADHEYCERDNENL